MKRLYPIMLDIEGKLCIVVGGGKVALRKVISLLDYGADVKVFADELCQELSELVDENKIQFTNKKYTTDCLEKAFLVFACTNNAEVNTKIKNDAENKNILVNVIDSPESCNFIVPSKIERGDLTIAISTNGKSPALAKKIRTELEDRYDESYAVFLTILGDIREKSLKEIDDINVRKELFTELVNSNILAKLQKQDKNIVIKDAEKIFERYKNEK